MDKPCPICKRLLTHEHKISYIDYYCHPSKPDHHYAVRLVHDQIVQMKIRLSKTKNKLFFKINYTDNYSEIWTQADDNMTRVRIEYTFTPNFEDLEKLENKVRTYMLLS